MLDNYLQGYMPLVKWSFYFNRLHTGTWTNVLPQYFLLNSPPFLINHPLHGK
jgi:hypothetical protein